MHRKERVVKTKNVLHTISTKAAPTREECNKTLTKPQFEGSCTTLDDQVFFPSAKKKNERKEHNGTCVSHAYLLAECMLNVCHKLLPGERKLPSDKSHVSFLVADPHKRTVWLSSRSICSREEGEESHTQSPMHDVRGRIWLLLGRKVKSNRETAGNGMPTSRRHMLLSS